MTYNRMIAAVMVMIVLAAGAGAAFCGAVIDGGVNAVGSIDLGSILLDDGDDDHAADTDDDTDNDAAVVQTWTSGDCTCTLYDDGMFLVDGIGAMADYTSTNIPWYEYREQIHSVRVVLTGNLHVGNYTFYNCTSLESIIMQKQGGNPNVTIGDNAFRDCTSLTSVTIPNFVTSIGDFAFYGCTSLTSVTISDSVTTIGTGAFRLCTSLASVTIGNSVIGSFAFQECASLASVTIGNGVSTIGQYAFSKCTSLTSIEFTSQTWNITSIGNSAFSLGTSSSPVTCTVISPGNMADGRLDAYKGSYTTFNYTSSTPMTVTLAAGTGGSVSPASLAVPYGSSVSASGNVLTVGSSTATATPSEGYSFSQWEGIPASGTITQDCTITAQFVHGVSWQSGDCTVALDLDTYAMTVSGRGAMADYTSNDPDDPDYDPNALAPWASYKSQITSLAVGDGVTRIGRYTFNDCTQITSLAVPNSVTEIQMGGFRYCTSLASVTFGDGLTNIGPHSFRGTALVSVTIPDSVTIIDNYAFTYCASLTSVTFGTDVATIGNHAFDGCSSLTSFSFPSSLTVINEYVLKDCTSLTSVTIPDGITGIGAYAMQGCTALTSVNIPSSVTSIGNYAFYMCGSLASVNIPASVTSIGNYAFNQCISLTSIYYDGLEWGITEIGSSAFSLGKSGTPVTCTVYSPLNCADGKLDDYKGSYTTFTYSSHGWYMLTFENDDPGWGSVSEEQYAIRENEQITVDGNAIMHDGSAIVRASPSDPTADRYYAFYSWSIEGTVTVTADMTVSAGFVRASVVPVSVLPQEYVDLDASPSYTGAEQVTDLPSWLSLDGTHIKGRVPAQNDSEWSAFIYWAKESVPRQGWTAYYYTFTAAASKEIELSAGATQGIGADGTMTILGHGDLTEAMCDMLTPYRDIVTVVDIRGLTSVRAMPEITGQFALVLGDTVTGYRDLSQDNHFGAVVIGAGIQQFNVPGFTAFDKDGKQITGRELQGRVLKEERARQYTEVGVISAGNHYDNATVYAVRGSTMDNSKLDRMVFGISGDTSSLPQYIRDMMEGASASWNVGITSAFKNLQVGSDGVLRGVQADKPGTYTGLQTASMTASEWGQMYSCTIMQSLAFTAYIADKLEVTS